MIKFIKVLGIIMFGLLVFVVTNYKFDGMQGSLEAMAYTLPSYLMSFAVGAILLLVTKKLVVSSIMAMLVVLFLQLGEFTSGQINLFSYVVSGVTLFLAIKTLRSNAKK